MTRFAKLSVLVALAVACSKTDDGGSTPPPPCVGADFDARPLAIRCGALVDSLGREVHLNGMNVRVRGVFDETLDGGRTPLETIPTFDADDARRIRALGFDALRLPIQWSGVEPTEGTYDDGYLDRVLATIDLAGAASLWVLVDLHQDAYSKEIGQDGAPYWAIVPPPPAKLQGPLTDLGARRLSKPVLDAFETFFGTSPDGERLRARFSAMAAHVAARIAAKPNVLGLELFNEPIATTAPLLAFHRQALAAVRAAAPSMLVFFEPPATRNVIDRADVPDAPLGPGTVYAPHVYTSAFASAEARAAVTRDLVANSYRNARQEADGWQAPLVVGEFGFPPDAPNFAAYVRWHAELADETRASTFFWVWKEIEEGHWGLFDFDASGAAHERASVVDALARVRLEACAGRVESVTSDDRTLVAKFWGLASTSENLVSFGDRFAYASASCDGAPAAFAPGEPARVTCGGAGMHVLEVAFARR